jgi:hypothetical protein
MTVQYFGNCVSQRKVYEWAERFKGGHTSFVVARSDSVAWRFMKYRTFETFLMVRHCQTVTLPHHYEATGFYFQHSVETQISIPEMLGTHDFSSVRLPTRCVTYPQRCFRQRMAALVVVIFWCSMQCIGKMYSVSNDGVYRLFKRILLPFCILHRTWCLFSIHAHCRKANHTTLQKFRIMNYVPFY